MTRYQFLKLCGDVLKKHGFLKKGNTYYMDGDTDISCEIYIQGSQYGGYYIRSINFIKPLPDDFFPAKGDGHLSGASVCMHKVREDGSVFYECRFEFDKLTEDDVQAAFRDSLPEVLKPLTEGSDHYRRRFYDKKGLPIHPLRIVEVLDKLSIGHEEYERDVERLRIEELKRRFGENIQLSPDLYRFRLNKQND